MSQVKFTLASDEDNERVITVYVDGGSPQVADSSHPNFDSIVEKALAGDTNVAELFDIAQQIGGHLEPLTERIRVGNGRIYFDGDEVDNACTKQLVRALEEDTQEWRGLASFLEKVQDNPQEHSRRQLFSFLEKNEITIADDGDIVAYKGVNVKGDEFESVYSGTAIVDGEVIEGKIPNRIGSIVEMPRSEVAHDPHAACSVGLHVATHGFAQDYGDAVLEVHVNPRDVVSVPNDAAARKVRTCRYWIEGVVENPYETAVKPSAPEHVDPNDDESPGAWVVVDTDNDEIVADFDTRKQAREHARLIPSVNTRVRKATPQDFEPEVPVDRPWTVQSLDPGIHPIRFFETRKAAREYQRDTYEPGTTRVVKV